MEECARFRDATRRRGYIITRDGSSCLKAMILDSLCRCVGPMRRWPTGGSLMERHCRQESGSSGSAKVIGTVRVIEKSDVSMKRFAGTDYKQAADVNEAVRR